MDALTFPTARIDLERRIVERADGARERLTSLEAALLGHLARHRDRVVSREELLAEVWGYAPNVVSRACDNTIRRLRTKIEVDPSDPEVLLTVHGSGYKLVGEAPVLLAATPDPVQQREPPSAPGIRLGDRLLDLGRARVDGPGGSAPLTANELALLEQLVAAGGAAIDRDQLQRRIWGSSTGRPLESTVSRLRRKLEADPARPRHLVTTALGYRLDLGSGAPPDLATGSGADATTTSGPADGVAPAIPIPTSLPAEVDARFGRDDLVEHIRARFEGGDRLVTLLGPGGVGKTRVALAAGRALGRPAHWVDLSGARTVDRMCAAVAQVLRLQLGADPLAEIGFAVQALGPVAILLDNLEQLGPAGASAVAGWVERAESAWFLVTSRTALRVRGERRLPVGPLDLDDGVALFVDRAIHPVADHELGEVRALVAELEAIPLAIELAAARSAVMGVAEIRRRLTDRMALLAVADPSRPARHRSLRASLDASWALATEPARAALSQLTVFGGGFTVDLAEQVLDLSAWPEVWIVDVVQELVDASLVRSDDDGRRFSLPTLVHDHAAQHLQPLARTAAELRHGRAFAELGRPERTVEGPNAVEHRRALAAELGNLLLAAERALKRRDGSVALPATWAAWEALSAVGPYRLALQLVGPLVQLDLDEEQRARALLLAGEVHLAAGNLDSAEVALAEASRIAATLGSAQLGAGAHLGLVQLRLLRDDPGKAESDAHVALTLARSLGSAVLECRALVAIGSVLRRQFRIDDGRRVLEAAIALARAEGLPRREAEARCELGELLDRTGGDGIAQLEQAAQAARDVGDRRLEAAVLSRIGGSLHARGQEWVIGPLEHAARLFRELGDRGSELQVLLRMCEHTLYQHQFERAERDLLAALRLAELLGAEAARDEITRLLGTLRFHAGRLDEAEELYRRGLEGAERRRDLSARAQMLAEYGRLHDARGRAAEARACWEEALSLVEVTRNAYGAGVILDWIGIQAHRLGRLEEAAEWFERSLAVAREHEIPNLVLMNLNNLAETHAALGAGERARELHDEALRLARISHNPTLLREVLLSVAEAAIARGERVEALALLDEAERVPDPPEGARPRMAELRRKADALPG